MLEVRVVSRHAASFACLQSPAHTYDGVDVQYDHCALLMVPAGSRCAAVAAPTTCGHPARRHWWATSITPGGLLLAERLLTAPLAIVDSPTSQASDALLYVGRTSERRRSTECRLV